MVLFLFNSKYHNVHWYICLLCGGKQNFKVITLFKQEQIMFLHLVVLVFFVNYLKEKLNLLWKSQKHIIAHYFVVTLQYANFGTESSSGDRQKMN